MSVTMQQVRERLDAIEPDYVEAATLGPAALPYLEEIAQSATDRLAPRAVYLASLIGGDRAARLLLAAISSPITAVRFQAAASAGDLPKEQAEKILLKALDDTDFGVRHVAVKSVRATPAIPPAIQKRLETLSKSDPREFIRKHSSELLRH